MTLFLSAGKDKCHAHLQEGRSRELQPTTLPFKPRKHDRAHAVGSYFQVHKGEGDLE